VKIKKLKASFGKFTGDSLELQPGLNIIRAPNESGKSTWCAFIRAMLYGINTSERDKQGYISDKNKYMPWSGSPMEGEMEIVHGGKDITLTRTSTTAGPMKSFSAVYSGTAQHVAELTPASAGEYLTGAGEKVFERTAFIRQAELRVSQNGDLEKRIAALVTSGNEQKSYSETDAQIRKWIREFKFNKSGSIPKLEAEKAELVNKYRTIEQKNDELTELRLYLEKTQDARDKLGEELELHKKIEQRNMLRSLEEAKAAAERARAEETAISNEISVSGRIPTKAELNEIRSKCYSMDAFNTAYVTMIGERDSASVTLTEAESRYKASVFCEKYENDEIRSEKAAFLAGYKKPERVELPQPPKAETYKGQIAFCTIFAVVGAIFAVLGFGFVAALQYYAPAGIALAVLGVIGVLLFSGKAKKSKAIADSFVPPVITDPLQEYYGVFGTEELDEMKASAREYLSAYEAYKNAAKALDTLNTRLVQAEEAVRAAEMTVLSASKQVLSGVDDPYAVLPRLYELDKTLDGLTDAKLKREAADSVIAALKETLSENIQVGVGDLLPVPDHSYEEAKAQYDKLVYACNELVPRYNFASGELRAIGDPLVISSQIEELDSEIKKQNEIYDSLILAQSALEEANIELQTRFSPVISKIAGQYMSALTGGRYSELTFDKAFNAMARIGEETVSRNILSLSAGTADQIYLALRLAMCTLMLGGDEPAPIILDDALVNFDSERMGRALTLLNELAKDRQIVLFTCHNREISFAENELEGVNTILFNDEILF